MLLFALGVSMATGLLFGLAPAAQSRCTRPRDRPQGGRRRDGGSGGGRHHVRRALVIAEVALAVMLVIGAGLLLRTVYNLTRVDAGFDRSRLVTFSMTLPRATSDAGGRAQAYQRLARHASLRTRRAGRHRDVGSAAESASSRDTTPALENDTAATGQTSEIVDYYQFVMSDYFETMGIPIVAGRGFDRTDIVVAGPGRHRQ